MTMFLAALIGPSIVAKVVADLGLKSARSKRETRLSMLIGWIAGTLSSPFWFIGTGWMLDSFSNDYWEVSASRHFEISLQIGALCCLAAVSIAKDLRNS